MHVPHVFAANTPHVNVYPDSCSFKHVANAPHVLAIRIPVRNQIMNGAAWCSEIRVCCGEISPQLAEIQCIMDIANENI
jgi:hypothetical protein